jgi:cell division protein ZapA (FtsZ GTPase activity inhibitor)
MKVQVTLRGRRYQMRADDSEVDVPAIARFVEGRMNEIASRAPNADEYTVALLAALNIASEFDRFRREVDAELEDIDAQLARTAVMIEAVLPGSATGSDE